MQVEALKSYRVIDMACGSGDAQTLCITDDDNVWSWGDGDYGKLGKDTSFFGCWLKFISVIASSCLSDLDPCGHYIRIKSHYQMIDIYKNMSYVCTNAQENGLCHLLYYQIVV